MERADEEAAEELEADIVEEAAKYGDVEKITVMAGSPEGVVLLKYKSPAAVGRFSS